MTNALEAASRTSGHMLGLSSFELPERSVDAQGLRNIALTYADEIGSRFVELLNRAADAIEAASRPASGVGKIARALLAEPGETAGA